MARTTGKSVYYVTLCIVLLHLATSEAFELNKVGAGISKSFYDMFNKFKTPFIRNDDGFSGGLTTERPKDAKIVAVVERAKPLLEQKTGQKFKSLEPVSYLTQEVAGTNYFAKVKAIAEDGAENVVFMRIYENIQKQVQLVSYHLNKKLSDKLDYF